MLRRSVITIISALALTGALAPPVFGQSANFPTKPVTLIIPWPAGGSVDVYHRALAEAAGKHLGQPVIVENKAGATGTAAPAAMAATAKPDGYTISHIPPPVYRLPFVQKASYDSERDFTYIISLIGTYMGTYVRSDSPFKSLKDMIEFARQNPERLTYSSPGVGSVAHIGMEEIAKREGVKWTHVPFTQGHEAALLGGHVMAMTTAPIWWPHTEAGTMRVLALWTEKRSPRLPDVPTLPELGHSLIEIPPLGIAGPKGMDPGIVRKLHDAFKLASQDPKVVEFQRRYDFTDRYMDSSSFAQFVSGLVVREKAFVERYGLARK
jgi:tripartite-type tricarboxylate transporter receptor subunit TctC